MKVTVNGRVVELQKKDRVIGGEAPAVKLKMLNGKDKVIGMMADKVQAIITLPFSHSLNDEINKVVHKYRDKANVYFISSDEFFYNVNKNYSSMDFENFCMKFGVYIDDKLCAKSIFIINKDGQIVYKNVLDDLGSEFDVDELDSELSQAVNFKKHGHTHENWMSA